MTKRKRGDTALPDPARPDVREWARWAAEPDDGQALRFTVTRRWPFTIVGWQMRPVPMTATDSARLAAVCSPQAHELLAAIQLAGNLVVNRNQVRGEGRTLGRTLARKGLRYLREARNLAARGDVASARAQVSLAQIAYGRLCAAILLPYAQRVFASERGSTAWNAQRGAETRAAVDQEARRLLGAGRAPRELAGMIARILHMHPSAVRRHLQALEYVAPARKRAPANKECK